MKALPRQRRTSRGRIKFRAARLSDSSVLLGLIRDYYAFDGIRFEADAIRAPLATLLRDRSLGRVWIMCDGNKPVGYIVLTFNYDLEFGGLEGIVTDLFIQSAYRRLGLGKRALDIVCEYCRSAGIRAVELQVEQHNRDAQAFYRKLGFRKLSRIVMSRNLH